MTLHSELIKLAHEVPSLRKHLVPLLKQAADTSPTEEGAKNLFERYKKLHPATKKNPRDFYEPQSGTGKKSPESTPSDSGGAKGKQDKRLSKYLDGKEKEVFESLPKELRTDPQKLKEIFFWGQDLTKKAPTNHNFADGEEMQLKNIGGFPAALAKHKKMQEESSAKLGKLIGKELATKVQEDRSFHQGIWDLKRKVETGISRPLSNWNITRLAEFKINDDDIDEAEAFLEKRKGKPATTKALYKEFMAQATPETKKKFTTDYPDETFPKLLGFMGLKLGKHWKEDEGIVSFKG